MKFASALPYTEAEREADGRARQRISDRRLARRLAVHSLQFYNQQPTKESAALERRKVGESSKD